MNKQALRFVQAFAELPPTEQAKVIDLIAEYYLATPRRRQALLHTAMNTKAPPAADTQIQPKAVTR